MLTNKICARHILTFKDPDLPLPIPIYRPWTPLGNTVFMQIVSSYNYERLIRSISTPNMYALFLTSILTPLLLTPSFCTPSIYTPLIYSLYKYTFTRTYIRTPLFLLPLFLLPTTLPSICTHNMYAFFLKIFPKKISTPKAYPKIFPKFLLICLLPLTIFQQ